MSFLFYTEIQDIGQNWWKEFSAKTGKYLYTYPTGPNLTHISLSISEIHMHLYFTQ